MTVSQANRLFDNGLESGQTISQVEAWLASQGIPPTRTAPPWAVSYDVLRRPEGGPFKDSWMDGRGGQTVAECAGLGVDDVYTVIRVSYPEADRFPLAVITITVYLFFDGQARLMRHWVDEFHLMP